MNNAARVARMILGDACAVCILAKATREPDVSYAAAFALGAMKMRTLLERKEGERLPLCAEHLALLVEALQHIGEDPSLFVRKGKDT